MATYDGSTYPTAGTPTIPVYLPREQRTDQQPSIYVVSIFDGPPTANPRIEIIPLTTRAPSSPPDTPPTDPFPHPAYYPAATGTVPSSADKPGWAETSPFFVQGQNDHGPDNSPAKPTEDQTGYPALSKLLNEIRQTQSCPHCQPSHGTKVSSVQTHSTASFCYYHRLFGADATKCRQPCTYPQRPRKKE